jgi:ankyrin repeat protein
MHEFDESFRKTLQKQLRLEFNNRAISDEMVLSNFPSAVRRKVLRKLYLKYLWKTGLMKDVRQQFVDAFLTNCKIEIFSPGEAIVERGSISSDLFLLVGGMASVDNSDDTDSTFKGTDDSTTSRRGLFRAKSVSVGMSRRGNLSQKKTMEAGDFIGEIGFFTESPQGTKPFPSLSTFIALDSFSLTLMCLLCALTVDTVVCVTVCKTLTMSRSTYKMLAQDHPGSVGKILQNLLVKVDQMSLTLGLPKNLSILRAGSAFDSVYGTEPNETAQGKLSKRQVAFTAIQDLVKMHMDKQKDDQTTRLLFAASRGDTATIEFMCDQGFDPNNADYDDRTALMIASMRGNTDVVKLLLERFRADPNLADVHGSTALMEAVKNAREDTMELLLKYGAKLCAKESDSYMATVLCQTVMDGDILFLRRLLRANINVNAADYDKRTAAHIAAAEGNVAALKVLVEHGADLTLEDRWKNTLYDEAVRANAGTMLEYLKTLQFALPSMSPQGESTE